MDKILQEKFDSNGKLLSPKLPRGIKNFLIDIDGTVSEDIPNEEPERMLTCDEIPGAKEHVNKWFDEGHIITFFTSRQEEHRTNTEQWLKEHGFKYHGIIFGKPRGGNYHWIDDRSAKTTRFRGKYSDLIKVQGEIEVFE
ncbi:MAG: phosphoheptose isomerase [Bacteroidia bacterium]